MMIPITGTKCKNNDVLVHALVLKNRENDAYSLNKVLLEDKYNMVKKHLGKWLMNEEYDGDVNKIKN